MVGLKKGEDPDHYLFTDRPGAYGKHGVAELYRPGDPPPSAWLPLFIRLHRSSGSPPFTRNHH